MQGVSDSTQQSTTSTREASQNMERLARLAEQLLASVEAFKLRDNSAYYDPTSNIILTPSEETNNQLTVSGVFRTVTGAAQPQPLGASTYNALAPVGSNASFSPYSPAPYPQYQPNGTQGTPQRSRQPEK
jgi:hypothetical protein